MKRLGKQRVESLQIMQVLFGERLVSKKFDHYRINKLGKTVAVEVDVPIDEWRLEKITTKGWISHSVTRMWRGYEYTLLEYQLAVCKEWTDRGYRDTCAAKTRFLFHRAAGEKGYERPPWLGREDIHSSHRATLLSKNPEHYGQFGWTEEPLYEYVWPVP